MKAKIIPQAVRTDVYTGFKMAQKKICIVSLKELEDTQFRNALIAKLYQVNLLFCSFLLKFSQIRSSKEILSTMSAMLA